MGCNSALPQRIIKDLENEAGFFIRSTTPGDRYRREQIVNIKHMTSYYAGKFYEMIQKDLNTWIWNNAKLRHQITQHNLLYLFEFDPKRGLLIDLRRFEPEYYRDVFYPAKEKKAHIDHRKQRNEIKNQYRGKKAEIGENFYLISGELMSIVKRILPTGKTFRIAGAKSRLISLKRKWTGSTLIRQNYRMKTGI